jgi:hypothetical protein
MGAEQSATTRRRALAWAPVGAWLMFVLLMAWSYYRSPHPAPTMGVATANYSNVKGELGWWLGISVLELSWYVGLIHSRSRTQWRVIPIVAACILVIWAVGLAAFTVGSHGGGVMSLHTLWVILLTGWTGLVVASAKTRSVIMGVGSGTRVVP